MRLSEEEYQALLRKRPPPKEVKQAKQPVEKKEVRHKFNAKITERDGYKFHSLKEAKRYDQLIMLQRSGEVLFFLRQVPIHLPGNVTYRVDFLVFWADGHVSVEDVKGFITPQFIDKRKMVEALYPITIEIL